MTEAEEVKDQVLTREKEVKVQINQGHILVKEVNKVINKIGTSHSVGGKQTVNQSLVKVAKHLLQMFPVFNVVLIK